MTTATRCNGVARSFRPTRSPAFTALPRIADERKVLGADVEIQIHAIDETNWRVRPDKLIQTIRDNGGRGMLGLVGVQSNQFPRALDIARPFLEAGVPVCMGGFHVAGSLAMLDETPPEIAAAADMGISYFIGESEDGRLDEVLVDAYAGKLKPKYDWEDKNPNLQETPIPFLPRQQVDRTYGYYGSFDLGRGCPFQCSFCTIINVQGRVSRFRSADDLEKIVRANNAIGVNRFFLTDDNLARNRNWEALLRPVDPVETEGGDPRLPAGPGRHALPPHPGLHREGREGRHRQRLRRDGEHQSRQSRGGEEIAEPAARIPRDVPRMEEAPGRHHRRLHHRVPERHARIDPVRHRGDEARAADRPDLFHQPDAVCRAARTTSACTAPASGWIPTSTNTT